MEIELNKIKVLAFDCDGTLMNTVPDYLYAMNLAMEHYSLPLIKEKEAYSFLGNGTDHFLTCAMRGQKMDQFKEIKEYYLSKYSNHFFVNTIIYPYIEEFLFKAKKKGYKLAVCSNKPEFVLKKLIKAAFPSIDFDFVGGQVGPIRKPNPLLLNQVADTLKCSKNEIAYFGDTEVDAEFAKNAFVNNLFIVTYGFRDKKYLMEVTNPIEFFDDVPSIEKYFKL